MFMTSNRHKCLLSEIALPPTMSFQILLTSVDRLPRTRVRRWRSPPTTVVLPLSTLCFWKHSIATIHRFTLGRHEGGCRLSQDSISNSKQRTIGERWKTMDNQRERDWEIVLLVRRRERIEVLKCAKYSGRLKGNFMREAILSQFTTEACREWCVAI